MRRGKRVLKCGDNKREEEVGVPHKRGSRGGQGVKRACAHLKACTPHTVWRGRDGEALGKGSRANVNTCGEMKQKQVGPHEVVTEMLRRLVDNRGGKRKKYVASEEASVDLEQLWSMRPSGKRSHSGAMFQDAERGVKDGGRRVKFTRGKQEKRPG